MNVEEKYRIRELTRKDRVTFTGLCQKLIDVTGNDTLAKLFIADETATKDETDSNSDDAEMANIVVSLLKQFISILDNEITEWFASLVNLSVEEYNAGPFDLDLIVIDQLSKADGMTSFFSLASGLFKKMTGSQKALQKTRKK